MTLLDSLIGVDEPQSKELVKAASQSCLYVFDPSGSHSLWLASHSSHKHNTQFPDNCASGSVPRPGYLETWGNSVNLTPDPIQWLLQILASRPVDVDTGRGGGRNIESAQKLARPRTSNINGLILLVSLGLTCRGVLVL